MSLSIENHCLEISKAVFPPNKPMEPRMEFSKSPVIYDNLLFLDFNDIGNCIVGTSDITGTFWEGTLLYFQDEKKMENFDFTGHYIYTTTSDAKFINRNMIALAEDTGNLNILSIDEDLTIRSINYFKLIERIPQLAVWDNLEKILACAGRSISIWKADSVDGKPMELFENYHLENITCVDTLRCDMNLFLSGARDRIVSIWDLRQSEPATVLYTNEFSSITSVAWNQQSDNYVIVGTQGGDLYLVDKREPNDFISAICCFDAPINRISFNSTKELAVCGDTNKVLILSSENSFLEIISHDLSHKGHVKGLKWFNGNLFSCGFGKSIIKHTRLE